jgi:glycosyltransferase involved in cell wall biosynthesis
MLNNNLKEVDATICMATFNGIRFIQEQVESILSQMGVHDELVIVDDASNDETVTYLESIGDPRIRIYRNTSNIGHVQSFAKVLSMARGKYILMADQDDIWVEGRLNIIREALSCGVALVSTNSKFIDSENRVIPPLHPDLLEVDSSRFFNNIFRIFIGKAYYDGCAMGLSRKLLKIILPIPSYVESHDLWIAMAANMSKSNRHLASYTLYRRLHGKNASTASRPLMRKILSRSIFLLSWSHVGLRLIKHHLKFIYK